MESNKMKLVYAITERGERSYWTRIGVAYTNRDGSLNVKLDAIPVNGTLQVREWTPREENAGPPQARRTTRKRSNTSPETSSMPAV